MLRVSFLGIAENLLGIAENLFTARLGIALVHHLAHLLIAYAEVGIIPAHLDVAAIRFARRLLHRLGILGRAEG